MSKYEDVVNLALRRSLFFPASEIYQNAPKGMFDYGPYGASIKRKVVDLWRKELVQKENFLEIDGAQIMPVDVFKASGHLKNFNDPVVQCLKCSSVFRADQLINEIAGKELPEAMANEEYDAEIEKNNIRCKKCKGGLDKTTRFSLMVKALVGFKSKTDCYLRPESCQSIFVDFARMNKTMRIKLPVGISQYGRVFRNEISPRQTLMRSVEFSQMETEIFFDPDKIDEIENFDEIKDYEISVLRQGKHGIELISAQKLVDEKIVSGKLVAYYLARVQQLYEKYGIPVEAMRFREVSKDDRAFYSRETWDFEVKTSIGWLELIANNYRTDYDLKGHMENSGQDMHYVYPDGKKLIPHVYEISIGVDRTFYAILDHAYQEETKKDEKRVLLSLPPFLAPMSAAVFPLLSNKPELMKKAKDVYNLLNSCYEVFFDTSGSIGKRYARMDEIGCPFCITVDFDSLDNNDVTIRERDSTEQKRIPIKDLQNILFMLITGMKKLKDF
ncbi:glycine--tRNA ligase [Candidatus Woesearchaeota archaeon]|nr:glycine--tRNA ligase [Candidatus Woesearchaeota archaeon]